MTFQAFCLPLGQFIVGWPKTWKWSSQSEPWLRRLVWPHLLCFFVRWMVGSYGRSKIETTMEMTLSFSPSLTRAFLRNFAGSGTKRKVQSKTRRLGTEIFCASLIWEDVIIVKLIGSLCRLTMFLIILQISEIYLDWEQSLFSSKICERDSECDMWECQW